VSGVHDLSHLWRASAMLRRHKNWVTDNTRTTLQIGDTA
jgi:hypothetical protein